MTTISSREFNQDLARAKRAARTGPVFITDRGQPSFVLLNFDAYRQMTGATESLVDLLALSDPAELDLDAARAEAVWTPRRDVR